MHRVERSWMPLLALIGVSVALLAIACSQPTHDERIAELRSKYEASLNGFIVQQEPVESMEAMEMAGEEGEMGGEAGEMAGEAGEMAGEREEMAEEAGESMAPEEAGAEEAEAGEPGEGGESMAEGAETGMEPAPPVRQNVLLDIVIRHDSPEKLPGITVDVSMADGEREIQTWRVYFDTSHLEKGPGVQYSHTLEDVDYQPGYGFSAEIRSPVPPEERHLYKEFSGAQ